MKKAPRSVAGQPLSSRGRRGDRKTVWMPFRVDEFDDLPDNLSYVTWDGSAELPEDPALANFYVHPLVQDVSVIRRPLSQMTGLTVMQALSSGIDHLVPLLQRRAHHVVLCSAGGVHSESTAELALTLILASLRGLPGFVRQQTEGRWAQAIGRSLFGASVLIIGYGAVGAAVDRLLAPFGCTVTRVGRTRRMSLRGEVQAHSRLPVLVPSADVIVVATAATDATRNLVDARFLARMKDGALLVNMSRGSVVDSSAVVAALRAGRIMAALDVTDPEPLPADDILWRAPGSLITPHVGAFTSTLRSRLTGLVQQQIWRFALNRPLHHVVQYPEGPISRSNCALTNDLDQKRE